MIESALEGGVSGKGLDQKAGDAEKEESSEETSWTGSSYMTAYQRFLEAYVEEENEYAKLLCSIRDYEPFDGSPKTYEIDGVSATEEAYDKKWEELYDTYEYLLIRYEDAFAIQELEIADLLAEAQNALLLQKEFPGLAEMVAEQSEVLEGYGVFLAEYMPQRTVHNSAEGPAFSLKLATPI